MNPPRKTGARSAKKNALGSVGIVAVVALLFLGGASLALANVTVHLQNGRADLRTALDEHTKEFNTASIRVAEREDVAYIKEQADAIGLVPTEHISYYEVPNEHLTRR